jgi:dipeptidyl aminopeptidase/acylaminoacyl peptidase
VNAVAIPLLHRWLLRRLAAPRVAHRTSPAALGVPAQAVRIAASGGKTLFGWFVPSRHPATAPAVLVMHGWGANAALMLPVLPPLHEAGHAVLLLDARCHGESDGEDFSSMPRFAEDIASGLDWLAAQGGVDPTRLALVGHSVGAGAALLCASRRDDVRAVVSLAAFAHPEDMMRRFLSGIHVPWWPLGWAITHYVSHIIGARFDDIAPVNTIARLNCPVLLVHGLRDDTVPFDDARRLLAAAGPDVRLLAVDADHDLSSAMATGHHAIIGFLQASEE